MHSHISRSVSNKILRAIDLILAMFLSLLSAELAISGIPVTFAPIKIPHDIRTAYQRYCITPEIIRTICCPKCFSLYQHHAEENGPQQCTWRESPRSRVCNTNLYELKNTRQGPKYIPRMLYTTQSFKSWLKFFLSRDVIEKSLDAAYQQTINHPINFGGEMHDIHDSPAWRDLQGLFPSPRNLQFALYVDWFNPFTNKIAGKVTSCGAIVLYCLNLPPNLRYRPENTFIIGITPPPHAPNMITICHLIEPVINSVREFSVGAGVQIPTFQFPNGVFILAKLAALIADLEASRKVAGFMQHSAKMFCSFCLCDNTYLEDLDFNSWQLRNGAQVRQEAEAWRTERTKAGRQIKEALNGVRWTPLHRLPYWDPVKHVVLGFMHNWLEGILQHHLRTLWGIGRDAKEQQQGEELEADEHWTNDDVSETAEELIELDSEQEESDYSYQASNPENIPPDSDSQSMSDAPTIHGDHYFPYNFDDDGEDDPDYEPPEDGLPFNFPDHQLLAIQTCIRDITLPTWAQRPPSNLGEPRHGKLKAHEYLTLFTCIFPIIIPEFWHAATPTNFQSRHLECFYHLIAATNIIASYKTSNADADQYTQHYVQYRQSIQNLFPYRPSKPNHHYAMHNGDLLKYWGPLASLSEFPGERMNGLMQNIKTNRKQS